MTEPYRSQLIQMLSDLSIGILKMLNDIRTNFSYYQSIVTEFETVTQELRKERISQINTNDLSVESLGDVLEASSVKILSLQAPVGRDLRMVLSSFRIIYDIKGYRILRIHLRVLHPLLEKKLRLSRNNKICLWTQ